MTQDIVAVTEKVIEYLELNNTHTVEYENQVLNVVAFSEPGPPGPIGDNVINAKGDLIVGNAQAQPSRLPIGDPNYFLMVDPVSDRTLKYTKTIDGGTF